MSSRVEDITDNIAEQPESAAAPEVQQPEMYNLAQAFRMIADQYKDRKFDKISLITPPQVVDGSIMEFADSDNMILAVARVRFRNRLIVNQPSGDITMLCQLSDLTFNRTVLPINITDEPASTDAAATDASTDAAAAPAAESK